jgi:hypothetical protein
MAVKYETKEEWFHSISQRFNGEEFKKIAEHFRNEEFEEIFQIFQEIYEEISMEDAMCLVQEEMEIWDSAESYEDCIKSAIESHESGDIEKAEEEFNDASRIEDGWGADPATTDVAESLGYVHTCDGWRLLLGYCSCGKNASKECQFVCADCAPKQFPDGEALYWNSNRPLQRLGVLWANSKLSKEIVGSTIKERGACPEPLICVECGEEIGLNVN